MVPIIFVLANSNLWSLLLLLISLSRLFPFLPSPFSSIDHPLVTPLVVNKRMYTRPAKGGFQDLCWAFSPPLSLFPLPLLLHSDSSSSHVCVAFLLNSKHRYLSIASLFFFVPQQSIGKKRRNRGGLVLCTLYPQLFIARFIPLSSSFCHEISKLVSDRRCLYGSHAIDWFSFDTVIYPLPPQDQATQELHSMISP